MIFSAKEVLLAATISPTFLPLPVCNFLRKSFNTSMKEAVIPCKKKCVITRVILCDHMCDHKCDFLLEV